MSKWVQFSFNCFWTPCVEKKTTEWQLLIQNANLWHGTVKMACHSQKAGVCYASHFSSMHATCPCVQQPLAFSFGTFLRGDSKHDSTECLAWDGSPGFPRDRLSEKEGRQNWNNVSNLEICDLAWKRLVSDHFVWLRCRIKSGWRVMVTLLRGRTGSKQLAVSFGQRTQWMHLGHVHLM